MLPNRHVEASGPAQLGQRGLTRHGAVPIGMLLAFEGLAWLTGGLWLHLLAALSLAVLIAAWVDTPRLLGLVVDVEHPQATTVGHVSTHRFTVTNRGARTTTTAHLRDHTHGLDDVTVLLPPLAPGDSTHFELTRMATARGVTPGHLILLSSTAPYGLRQVTAAAQLMAPVVVRPALIEVPALQVLAPDGELSPPGQPRRDGPVVRGLREWRSGDDARQVHWRASAKRGRLVVLEREAPPQARVTFLIIAPGDHDLWEYSVAALASLALQAIRTGYVVNLFADQADHDSLLGATVEAALDGCAALTPAGWPTEDLIRRAAEAAGSSGAVHVVAPGLADGGWPTLEARLAQHGVAAVDAMASKLPALGARR